MTQMAGRIIVTREQRGERPVIRMRTRSSARLELPPPGTSLIAILCQLVLAGCVFSSSTVEIGKPLQDAQAAQIEIGKTTRSDLFRSLGTPHSLFQGQPEFKEKVSTGHETLGAPPSFWYSEFWSHSNNRYLSSLDDRTTQCSTGSRSSRPDRHLRWLSSSPLKRHARRFTAMSCYCCWTSRPTLSPTRPIVGKFPDPRFFGLE